MALILTTEQKAKLTINPVTAAGNPGKLDGIPQWSVSDSNVLTLDVAPDGLSAFVLSNNEGVSQVSVIGDGDLGEGVRQIVSLLDIQVVPAEAVSIGISVGTPELK